MKRLVLSIALLFVSVVFSVAAAGHKISGSVTAQGKGVAGVVVTDGNGFSTTDAAGKFSLETAPDSRFVYISTPAGYDVASEGIVKKFYIPVEAGRKSYDFHLIKKNVDDSRHAFIAVADAQVWAEKEFEQLALCAADIKTSAEGLDGIPVHGIGLGDMVFDKHHFFGPYNAAMAETGLAFYHAIGNHDMDYDGRSFETSTKTYESVYGPTYYSYNVGRIHYVTLNDCFFVGRQWYYIGYITENQIKWLERDLSYIEKGSTIVVCLHIPSTVGSGDRERFRMCDAANTMTNHPGFYKVLEGYNAHIVSGHYHTMYNGRVTESVYEHNVAAICGTWWQGPECTDGSPRGYAVFEADGDSLRWRYKGVGHPADYQLRVYGEDDDPAFAGMVVANVWNSDEQWIVELWEDGVNRGPMERFRGKDPVAIKLYGDVSKLDHKWIEIEWTEHLYRAKRSSKARRVEVKATDIFGNTFSATL